MIREVADDPKKSRLILRFIPAARIHPPAAGRVQGVQPVLGLTDLEFLIPAITAFGKQDVVTIDAHDRDVVDRPALFDQPVVDHHKACGGLGGPYQGLQLDTRIAAVILIRFPGWWRPALYGGGLARWCFDRGGYRST